MTQEKPETQDVQTTKNLCVEFLLELKGEDIQVINLTGLADFTDYFILCSAGSDTHAKALADSVLEGMRDLGHRPWHREGYDSCKWVLLDYVDVVVHIFQRDVREYYSLERLWSDAPIENIVDEGVPAGSAPGPANGNEG